LVHGDIEGRLTYSDSVCWDSFHNSLSSNILPKKAEIKIPKIVTLSALFCGCPTLRKGHGVRVVEDRVLRKIHRPKRLK
jgi:hypothetical protein